MSSSQCLFCIIISDWWVTYKRFNLIIDLFFFNTILTTELLQRLTAFSYAFFQLILIEDMILAENDLIKTVIIDTDKHWDLGR